MNESGRMNGVTVVSHQLLYGVVLCIHAFPNHSRLLLFSKLPPSYKCPAEAMPNAWSQLGYHTSPLPTKPSVEGTLLFVSTRHQRCFHRVYETTQSANRMMAQEGAFSLLSDLGTTLGNHVGETKYAGHLPMSEDDLLNLSNDSHGFEKLLRASAKGRVYYYCLFMQSYGPTWGNEGHEDLIFSDASGPLHVYVRTSDMRDDVWRFYNITDNYADPIYGSQSWDINTWYQAPQQDWRYMDLRDYSSHPHFNGWHLSSLAYPLSYMSPASAPAMEGDEELPTAIQPIQALSAPGPIVMGEVVGYDMVQTMHESPRHRCLLACCPFTKR